MKVQSAADRVLLAMTTLVYTLSHCVQCVTVCIKELIFVSSLPSCSARLPSQPLDVFVNGHVCGYSTANRFVNLHLFVWISVKLF